MKKFISLGLITIIGFLTSCSNDFELTADWEDIPIVYGFISRSDDIHYIRIEKAFLDPEKSAIEIAQIADSLYYDNLLVQIERIDKEGEIITLQQADGSDEGLVRKEGVFATKPNTLYKFELADDNKLEGGERIRLMINRADTKPLVTAETTVLENTEFVQGRPGNPMNFEYNRPFRFGWQTGEFAYLFDLKMFIHIEESDPDDPSVFIPKTLTWVLKRNIERDGDSPRVQHNINGEEFYQFLQNSLDETASIKRVMKSIDVQVSAGGIELLEFLRITQANTGITSSQVIPSYTNISEGLGLFTSRNVTVLEDLGISSMTRDSLTDGIFTKNLNFQ